MTSGIPNNRSEPLDFAVIAPQRHAYVVLFTLTLGLPALLIALLGENLGSARSLSTGMSLTLLMMLVVTALICLAMRRRGVRLANGVLDIRATLYRRRVPLGDIDLAASRVVDLREKPEWRPRLRMNGMGLPGFRAGHFRLRDWSKAFVLLTDPAHVLVLRLREGGCILLSVESAAAVLETLRQAQ